eukprot:7893259-Prorocentrum_lima.AAC.1
MCIRDSYKTTACTGAAVGHLCPSGTNWWPPRPPHATGPSRCRCVCSASAPTPGSSSNGTRKPPSPCAQIR